MLNEATIDETAEAEAEAGATEPTRTAITFENGVVKAFGAKTKVIIDHEISPTNITLTIYQADKNFVVYTRPRFDQSNEISDFNALMAARGFINNLKVAVLGAKLSESELQTPDDETIAQVIARKLKEYDANILSMRSSGSATKEPPTQLEMAYALKYNIDLETDEGYNTVHDWYLSLSKETRLAMRQKPRAATKTSARVKAGPLYLQFVQVQILEKARLADRLQAESDALGESETETELV